MRSKCAIKDEIRTCPADANIGHILCEYHRIECGGYNRYTLVSAEQLAANKQQTALKEQ